MRLGQAKCPHCGAPLTTEITSWRNHVENCEDNPKNINNRWIKLCQK